MVLWEIALVAAWFLGLKRTHKLSLTLQRRIISPKHPKLRDFVQRRTRRVFDVAVWAHLKFQQRKVEIEKNIGNWIIGVLDKKKPLPATINDSRLIKGSSTASSIKKLMSVSADKVRVATNSNTASSIKKLMNNSAQKVGLPNLRGKVGLQNLRGKSERLFTVARNMWPKASFPTVPTVTMNTIMRPANFIQNRQFIAGGTEHFTVGYRKFGLGDVVRSDIRQYLMSP